MILHAPIHSYSDLIQPCIFAQNRCYEYSVFQIHIAIILIPVMFSLVGSADGNAYVISLLLRKPRKLDSELLKMKPRNFLVKLSRQAIYPDIVVILPKAYLRKSLIRERIAHYER